MTALKLISRKKAKKLDNIAFSRANEFTNCQNVTTTSVLFKLHSHITPVILLAGVVFLSFKEYFDDAIDCLQLNTEVSKELIERYCLYEGAFVFYDSNQQIAYPDVNNLDDGKQVFIRYYQWIYFVLIIQAILFYMPKYVWDIKEGKKLKELCLEANKKPIGEMSDKERDLIQQVVFDSLITGPQSLKLFSICEMFYLMHLIAQIWFVNIFLNGKFIRLGYDWLVYNNDRQLDYKSDPLVRVFPRLTKCNFLKYGLTGEIERHDTLCLLSLNIINEKIYITLYFWFCFLILFTTIFLTARLISYSSLPIRFEQLKSNAPLLSQKITLEFSHKTGYWFVIRLMSDNMKPSHFTDLIDQCYRHHFGGDENYSSFLDNKLNVSHKSVK